MREATALGLMLTVFLLGPAPSVAAGPAAALVLEASDGSGAKSFTELAAGTTVALGSAGRLVMLHYRTCRTVTVEGGRLVVTAERYTTEGSTSVRESPTPCPRPVTLRPGGEVVVGGVVTRSLRPPLALAPQPAFVLVGPRAGAFARARVARDGTEVLTVDLDGPRLRWPAGAAPLAVSAIYELTLLPGPGNEPTATLRFHVARPEAAGEPVTLVHVE